MERVIVTAAVAALYESGQKGALLSDELLCGMGATLMKRFAGGIVRVRSDYGYEGYGRDNCFATEDAGWQTASKLIVTGSYINVQQQPMVRSVVVLSLPRGSLVCAQGPSVEGWQPILLAGGQQGYAQAVHLTPYPMGEGLDSEHLRRSICRNALSYMGCCYRWGGKTPLGIDCSGLCSQVYLSHGIAICRDARLAEGFPVQEVAFDALEPADLLYWRGHIALWLGNGRYIHSAASSGGVTVNSMIKGEVDYREDLAKTLLACGAAIPRKTIITKSHPAQ